MWSHNSNGHLVLYGPRCSISESPTWTQVADLISGTNMALNGSMGHRHQQRPKLKSWALRPDMCTGYSICEKENVEQNWNSSTTEKTDSLQVMVSKNRCLQPLLLTQSLSFTWRCFIIGFSRLAELSYLCTSYFFSNLKRLGGKEWFCVYLFPKTIKWYVYNSK